MKKTSLALSAAFAVLLLAGAGCGGKAPTPAPQPPAANQPSKPTSIGLPRQTQQQFDEDDHLDAALKDLDTVEP